MTLINIIFALLKTFFHFQKLIMVAIRRRITKKTNIWRLLKAHKLQRYKPAKCKFLHCKSAFSNLTALLSMSNLQLRKRCQNLVLLMFSIFPYSSYIRRFTRDGPFIYVFSSVSGNCRKLPTQTPFTLCIMRI